MKFDGIESATLEFKREKPSKQQIINTIIGFCNFCGGRLVIGVADDGTVIGIDEEQAVSMKESLHSSIVSSCTPIIIPSIYLQRLGEKIVLVIEVSSGMTKPYFRSDEGLVNGTYLRLGPETVKARPEMVRELQWEAQGHFLDEMPLHRGSVEDLDLELFKQYLSERGYVVDGIHLGELLTQYGLLAEEHRQSYPSVGGILLFGKKPQHLLPEAYIICTQFRGTEGREAIASQDCTGTLFQQLNQAFTFVESRLNKEYTIDGLRRRERLEIPVLALREAIINAVLHRNYLIPGPSKIAIFGNRLEIYSPGNFPRPIPLNQLECGVSMARNCVISQCFRQAKLVERMGSGWTTIFSSYRQWHLPEPSVMEGTGFVKVVLPRFTATTDMVPDASRGEPSSLKEILRLAECQGRIAARDVISRVQVSRQTASRLLAQLVDDGMLRRVGRGNATHYEFIRKGP